MIVVAAEQQAE